MRLHSLGISYAEVHNAISKKAPFALILLFKNVERVAFEIMKNVDWISLLSFSFNLTKEQEIGVYRKSQFSRKNVSGSNAHMMLKLGYPRKGRQ